ncbi:hypothetical protein PybrP1_004379 [[Pythium] brassicae (nom. inval.)]|nr:hypothetical protein PybrP1_004379 [[Pythium] brassicae (nom. inval.)]
MQTPILHSRDEPVARPPRAPGTKVEELLHERHLGEDALPHDDPPERQREEHDADGTGEVRGHHEELAAAAVCAAGCAAATGCSSHRCCCRRRRRLCRRLHIPFLFLSLSATW